MLLEITLSEENNTSNDVQAPSLGMIDIQNALKIIDYACEQGAFKGWNTITQVQSVRNKLATFLAVAEAATASAEATENVEEPTGETEA